MRQLCHVLGDPQTAFPVVHVTGTNGKGSVVAMVAGLLAAQGLTVGTYTSPHLVTVNERIRRNGEPISDEQLAQVLAEVAAVEPLVAQSLSWFELLTAAALSWFATSAVDVAVVEVGMLGRWDATNVVDGTVAVVTNVGFDHTDGRGDWEMLVASEKAGIVRPGATLVLGETNPRLRPVFESEGPSVLWTRGDEVVATDHRQAVGGQVVDITTPYGTHNDIFVRAHGAHQADNAALAVAATEALFERGLADDVVAEALGSLELPGRLTITGRHPLVVVDGAHNPPAAQALSEALIEGFAVDGRRVLVLGMLTERDPRAFLRALDPLRVDAVVTCTVESARAWSAGELAAVVGLQGVAAEAVDDPQAAVERAVDIAGDDGLVVVTGSLYLVGACVDSLRRSPGT